MKSFLVTSKRSICFFVALLILSSVGYGATFTAATSGNFSSGTTWVGGIAPSFTDSVDLIIVPSGITVNLDNNLTLSGALARLDVAGTLNTTTSASITNTLGTILGAGTIVVDKVNMAVGSVFTFTGNLTTNTLNALTSIQTTANLLVNQTLNLAAGTLNLISGGKLELAPNGTIVMAGGILTKGVGGILGLAGNHNVTYTGNSSTVGAELSGTGLKNVTVNVDSTKSVTLLNDLTVPGVLTLSKGTLVLAGKNLTVNGTVGSTGTGTISSTAASNVTLNSTAGTTGTLAFSGAASAVKNLIVNVGAGNTANISGIVAVDSMVQLNSGVLNFNNATLSAKGISGTGSLSGNSSSSLNLTGVSGIPTTLNFAANGQTIKDLSIPTGATNAVSLASPLTVNGALALPSGSTLNVNGNALTLGAGSSIIGTGTLATNATSDLIVNSTAGIPSLPIAGAIRNLTVNSDTGAVRLANDLTVGGVFNPQSGTLVLNGKNLTINGNIAPAGLGMITSTNASNITINTQTGTNGALNFAGTTSAVKNLIVNTGSAAQAAISGIVSVDSSLQLNSGTLNINNASLAVKGVMTGAGKLTGNALSNLDLSAVTGLASTLNFATDGQMLKDLKLPTTMGNTVSLASPLTVNGMLTLPAGSSLNLNGNALTLGAGSSISGTGNLVTNATSDVIVNSTAGLATLPITDAVRNLTINSGAGAVTLAKDLTVSGMLALQSGTLALNGKNLTINGNIAPAGLGSIASTNASNITINTPTGTNGALNFGGTTSAVKNLIVNTGSATQAAISGIVSVDSSLQLNSGTLNINNASLAVKGVMTGAGKLAGNALSNLDLSAVTGLASTLNFATDGQMLKDLKLPTVMGNTVSLASPLTVNGMLTLPAGSSLNLNGNALTLGAASSIAGTGNLVTNATSDVIVNSTAGLATLPITDAVRNLTINSGAGAVTLAKDLTVSGMLALQSGTLALNGKNLTINGNIAPAGLGSIASTNASTITINTPTGTNGALNFAGTTSAVKNLIVNTGSATQAVISGIVSVDSSLQLSSGTLNINNASLAVKGVMSGTGKLSGNASSNLDLSAVTGLASTLNFATDGQMLKDLKLPTTMGNTVSLASPLTVNGMLTLPAGSSLNLNGNALTLGAASSIAGTGNLVTNATSDVIVNSTAGLATLPLSAAIRNLTINSGSGSVTLAKDLAVSGMLSLQSGTLALNGNDLTINGSIATTGTGTISSDLNSDITIATLTSPLGALNFSANANTIRNLTVAIVNGGVATIGSNLNINNDLQFIGGKLDIGNKLLSVGATGAISGSSRTSYINTEAGGSVEMFVTAGANSAINFPVGTATQFAPALVKLNAGSENGQVQVGVIKDVKAQGIIGADMSSTKALVDATWDVKSKVINNLNMNLQVMWSKAMEVNGFNRTSAYITHYINGTWDSYTQTAASIESDSLYSVYRNGITSLSPFTVFDMTTTEVNELTNDITFEVFPNPTTDNIIIHNPITSAVPVNMDIYNSIGQLMTSSTLTGSVSTVSVKELQSGVYFIKFYNNGISTVKSFTKI